MKRILVVTPMMPPEAGGPGTYAAIIARELPKIGVDVSIANYGEARSLTAKGTKAALFSDALRLAKEADAVLALDPASVGLIALIVSKLTRKLFFLRVPGDYAWEQATLKHNESRSLDEFIKSKPGNVKVRILWWLERFIAKRANRVIVPSEYLRHIVETWGVSPERIVVVGNAYDGVVETLTNRAEVRGGLGIPENTPLIITAGRLVPWKGIAELVRAFSLVHKQHPKATLLIAGDGPESQNIKKVINDLNLKDEVRLLGSLPKSQLHSLLAAADVFVLNSRYEGLSHQILEAMALNVPVVATKVGGNPETVRDGETGWLVNYDDEISLIKAISDAIIDRGEATRRVVRARTFISTLIPEKVAKETLAALNL